MSLNCRVANSNLNCVYSLSLSIYLAKLGARGHLAKVVYILNTTRRLLVRIHSLITFN